MTPIENHKSVCQSLVPEGWQYGGFDDGYYLFQSGTYSTGLRLMECREEDLTKENLALMVKLGVTRGRGLLK